MPSVNINTSIEISTEVGTTITTSNQIKGKTEGSTSETGVMSVDHADTSSWKLDTATGAAFSLDVASLVNNGTAAEIKVVHVQCRVIKGAPEEEEFPAKFNVTLGTTSLGKMGQITMADMEAFTQSIFTISDVTVPTGRRAILTVTFVVDKA